MRLETVPSSVQLADRMGIAAFATRRTSTIARAHFGQGVLRRSEAPAVQSAYGMGGQKRSAGCARSNAWPIAMNGPKRRCVAKCKPDADNHASATDR
jgi:hypothetical protein